MPNLITYSPFFLSISLLIFLGGGFYEKRTIAADEGAFNYFQVLYDKNNVRLPSFPLILPFSLLINHHV